MNVIYTGFCSLPIISLYPKATQENNNSKKKKNVERQQEAIIDWHKCKHICNFSLLQVSDLYQKHCENFSQTKMYNRRKAIIKLLCIIYCGAYKFNGMVKSCCV